LDPCTLELLKFSEDSRFKAPKDAVVRSLYLSIGLRVGHCGPSYVDLLFIAEVDKCASHELGAIFSDDRVHDRCMTSLMNSIATSELAVATGLASIHLVNLSAMTNK
jgi:hypothetical protein